jgi:hypothetical protein
LRHADSRPLTPRIVNRLARLPLALFCLLALSCAGARSAEPRVTVTVSQSGEAFIIDATLEVAVSRATAWEVLTDFDHMTSILGNLTSSKVTARDGNTLVVRQEGVARYGLLSFSFESEREIRLEPMKRIVSKSLSGTLKRMDSEARIVSLEHGVQVKYHAESVPDSMLARIFGASFVRHEIEEQFLEMGREMGRRHIRTEPAPRAGLCPMDESVAATGFAATGRPTRWSYTGA